MFEIIHSITYINNVPHSGYIPPEYIHMGEISNKFDIFSLGVVITKIMTGPDGYYRSDETSPEQFVEIVRMLLPLSDTNYKCFTNILWLYIIFILSD